MIERAHSEASHSEKCIVPNLVVITFDRQRIHTISSTRCREIRRVNVASTLRTKVFGTTLTNLDWAYCAVNIGLLGRDFGMAAEDKYACKLADSRPQSDQVNFVLTAYTGLVIL